MSILATLAWSLLIPLAMLMPGWVLYHLAPKLGAEPMLFRQALTVTLRGMFLAWFIPSALFTVALSAGISLSGAPAMRLLAPASFLFTSFSMALLYRARLNTTFAMATIISFIQIALYLAVGGLIVGIFFLL
jgi:hypothetical protein